MKTMFMKVALLFAPLTSPFGEISALNIDFNSDFFAGVNGADATAVLKVWVDSFAQSRGVIWNLGVPRLFSVRFRNESDPEMARKLQKMIQKDVVCKQLMMNLHPLILMQS